MCVDVSTFEEAEDDHKINNDVDVCKNTLFKVHLPLAFLFMNSFLEHHFFSFSHFLKV